MTTAMNGALQDHGERIEINGTQCFKQTKILVWEFIQANERNGVNKLSSFNGPLLKREYSTPQLMM